MRNHVERLEQGRFAEQCKWPTWPEFRQPSDPLLLPEPRFWACLQVSPHQTGQSFTHQRFSLPRNSTCPRLTQASLP